MRPSFKCFLTLVAILMAAISPAVAADKLKLTAVDYWTYTQSLESSKAYTTLGELLANCVSAATGVTNLSSLDTNAILSTPDLEGVTYMLDDLASVYSIGVVDFDKAQFYNNLARIEISQVAKRNIASLPISSYFDSRRSLYYFIYPSLARTNKLILSDGEKYQSFFNNDTLLSVRSRDFAGLAMRVEQRTQFLTNVINGRSKTRNSGISAGDPLLLKKIFEDAGATNIYYVDFYSAQHLWLQQASGQSIDYKKLRDFSEEALALSNQRDTNDSDSRNWLLCWAGFSNLELNNDVEGTGELRRFFWEILGRDKVDEDREKQRRLIMGKAVDEVQHRYNTIAISLSIGASIADCVLAGIAINTMVSEASGIITAEQISTVERGLQSTMQGLILQTCVLAASTTSLNSLTSGASNQSIYEHTQALVNHLGLTSLQVGRYLNKYEQVDLYTVLGDAYFRRHDNQRAIHYYGEALNIIELERSTIQQEDQRTSFFKIKESTYPRIVDLLVEAKQYDKAFDYVERARARSFLDLILSRDKLSVHQSDTARFNQEITSRGRLSAMLSQRNLSREQLQYTAENFPIPGVRNSHNFELLVQSQTITSAEMAREVPKDTTVLEYFLGERHPYLFCFCDGNMVVYTLRIDIADLKSLVDNYYSQVRHPYGSVDDLGRQLYSILIAPAELKIQQRNLVIIPQGCLHEIPFAALISDNGNYLIESHAIQYAPSASIYDLILVRPRGSGQFPLVIANPLNLPTAKSEADTIASSFHNSLELVGTNATIGNFLRFSGDASFIHVAAHAKFVEGDPLDSYLLLWPDAHSEDGFLHAGEMYQLSLNAQAVVLSACESGRTVTSQNDELDGLMRPLLYAGANSVIGSLWWVQDRATSEQMIDFYQNLSSTNMVAALQRAQVELLRYNRNPYYWAAFVLYGQNF
jgi:CHAT domain-containing protein